MTDKSEGVNVGIDEFDDSTVKSNIEFHKVGDYVTYKMTVKNNDDKDYTVKSISHEASNDNLEYEYESYVGTKVKRGETLDVLVKVTYKTELTDITKRVSNDSTKFKFLFVDEDGNEAEKDISYNPNTFDNIWLYIILGIGSLFGLLITLVLKKKTKKVALIMIIGLICTPFVVKALEDNLVITFNNVDKLYDKLVVEYDNNGVKEQKVVAYNSKLEVPEEPTREGYNFLGWYTEEDEEYDFTKDVTKDAKLVAKWEIIKCQLTINDSEYVESTKISGEYPYGTEVTLTAKNKQYYSFTKWSNNETSDSITITLTGNVEIGPVYTRDKYEVTFNTNGGTLTTTSREVDAGTSIGELPVPTPPVGKDFEGWYTNLTEGIEVTSSYIVNTNNMTIYARYTDQTFTVSFDTDGGSNITSQTITYGQHASRPTTNPTKDGYKFINWYTNANYNTVFDFDNTDITTGTTIYAKFVLVPFRTVFSEPGECIFNGADGVITGDDCSYANGTNKYIDTGINLYNTTNHDKDYEIGFTIVSYNPSDQVKQATLMNTKLEGGNYPGLVFRRKNTEKQFDLSSRKTSSANVQLFFNNTNTEKVKIYRIYNENLDVQEIFYSINDGEKVKVNDLSTFNPTFNLSVWFGAAPVDETSTTAQRILVGTMKDMYIKLGTYTE